MSVQASVSNDFYVQKVRPRRIGMLSCCKRVIERNPVAGKTIVFYHSVGMKCRLNKIFDRADRKFISKTGGFT